MSTAFTPSCLNTRKPLLQSGGALMTLISFWHLVPTARSLYGMLGSKRSSPSWLTLALLPLPLAGAHMKETAYHSCRAGGCTCGIIWTRHQDPWHIRRCRVSVQMYVYFVGILNSQGRLPLGMQMGHYPCSSLVSGFKMLRTVACSTVWGAVQMAKQWKLGSTFRPEASEACSGSREWWLGWRRWSHHSLGMGSPFDWLLAPVKHAPWCAPGGHHQHHSHQPLPAAQCGSKGSHLGLGQHRPRNVSDWWWVTWIVHLDKRSTLLLCERPAVHTGWLCIYTVTFSTDTQSGVLRVWTVSKSTPLESLRVKKSGFHALHVLPTGTGASQETVSPEPSSSKSPVPSKGCPMPPAHVVCTFLDGGVGLYDLGRRKWGFLRDMVGFITRWLVQFEVVNCYFLLSKLQWEMWCGLPVSVFESLLFAVRTLGTWLEWKYEVKLLPFQVKWLLTMWLKSEHQTWSGCDFSCRSKGRNFQYLMEVETLNRSGCFGGGSLRPKMTKCTEIATPH